MFKNIGIVLKNSPTSGDSSVLNKLIKVLSGKTKNIFSIDNVNIDQVKSLNIEEFNVTIRSFFADEDESCSKHFTIMFKMLHRNNSVDRVIMVADSKDLNNAFQFSPELLEKNFFYSEMTIIQILTFQLIL